jgi:phosphoenolpyruvate-protein kinase (PTS system EI component)
VFPTEAAQAVHYKRVLDSMNGKPVVFRLLDIGGDKPLPYAPHPKENNPFLGWRGIRYLIDNPDILISQIRAILSASAESGRKVRIMVPMVCSPSEMRVVRDIIERERAELGGEGMVGMMVETPAAAMTVPAFKGICDFISIGSNDLTQYTLAADRENELLGNLYSEFHPGVLALMRKAANDARDCGMETGICGEFASTPEGALYLAAMGFDELSMSHGSISAIKEIIRGIRIDDAERLLDEALAMRSAAETRKLARDFIDQKGLGA